MDRIFAAGSSIYKHAYHAGTLQGYVLVIPWRVRVDGFMLHTVLQHDWNVADLGLGEPIPSSMGTIRVSFHRKT